VHQPYYASARFFRRRETNMSLTSSCTISGIPFTVVDMAGNFNTPLARLR